jgi:hypothetical protein
MRIVVFGRRVYKVRCAYCANSELVGLDIAPDSIGHVRPASKCGFFCLRVMKCLESAAPLFDCLNAIVWKRLDRYGGRCNSREDVSGSRPVQQPTEEAICRQQMMCVWRAQNQ